MGADRIIRLQDHEERSPDTINISVVCNQRCLFCAGYSRIPLGEEEIRDRIRGKRSVTFQGGEPTLNPSLFRYARYAREQGAEIVTLVTNGLRLSYRRFAAGCLEAGINRFFFALPSHRQEVCDHLSQVPGAYPLKLQGLANLVELGAAPQVRLVHLLNRYNYSDLPGFVRFVGERFPAINAVEIKLMQLLGNVEQNRELLPSFTQLQPVLDSALECGTKAGRQIVVSGIPPCLFPAHHSLSLSYHMKCITRESLTGCHLLPVCEGCPLAFCCFGVRSDYMKVFGPGEIERARGVLPPVSVPPEARPPDAKPDRGSDRELQRQILQHLEADRPADALGPLRLLLGVSGAEPTERELRAPRSKRVRLIETLTMSGFKPAELAILEHDLKAVVKLEDIEPAEAERFFDSNRDRYHLVRSEAYRLDDLSIDQIPGAPGTDVGRVTIYASRGEEAYRLQRLEQSDPASSAAEAGRLLGYPACCVEHFVQVSRRCQRAGALLNEELVRSAIRRSGAGLLPFQTSLFTDINLISFYPCSFSCPEAVRWADRVLAALHRDDPRSAARCRAECAQPVLFFRLPFIVFFEGKVDGRNLHYRGFACNSFGRAPVRAVQELFCRDLGRLLAKGDRLTVTDDTLQISKADRLICSLRKERPDSCLLLPFN